MEGEARRLLADDRVHDSLERFTVEWLGIDAAAAIVRDPARYPRFDGVVAKAMRDETVRFVEHVIRLGDARLETLLSASWSMPTADVLPLYGVTPPDGWLPGTRLELGPLRAGVWTQPSVLAATSHMADTSPIKRGVFVLDNVVCRHISFPTGLTIPPLPDKDPSLDKRQRFAIHEAEPVCASCHKIMDPLGFAFERYDAVGEYREAEDGRPIDDRADIAIGADDVDGPVAGAAQLAHKLARSEVARSCMVEQMHRFALQRDVVPEDQCSLAGAEARFAESGGDVRELMLAVVQSPSFRQQPADVVEPGAVP